jgi:hypothetical protein
MAVALLVLSVAAIAAAVTAQSEGFAFTALGWLWPGWPRCSLASSL